MPVRSGRAALFFGGGGNRALFPVAQQTLERRPVILLAAQSPARWALAHACRRGPFHPASLADPRLFRRRASRHPPPRAGCLRALDPLVPDQPALASGARFHRPAAVVIAAAAGLEQAAGFLLHLANIPCEALLHSLRWLQAHAGLDLFVSPRPHWTAILGFGAIAVALAMRIHRDHFPHAAKRLLISGALLLSVGPLLWVHAFFEPKISLRVLDVGQGQAVLLEWPYGGRAMVDGGGLFSDRFDVGRDLVSLVLTANNLPRLDFIAVTHPDRDHLKGLLFIAANYAMKAAYTAPLEGIDTPQHDSPRPLSEAFTAILASRGIPRHTLGAGNVLPLADGLALEVLAPAPGVTPSGNDGLVFRLVLNGHGLALLPGDAEAPYLRALLRSGADLSADVLVLPHHGSAGSLVPALYDAVSPKLAIASAGAYNPYRLPSRKVRDALEWRDIPLHITGNEGEIAVHWDLKKNAGKKNILQEGFPPPRPHLSQYVQPMGRARESSPAGNTK